MAGEGDVPPAGEMSGRTGSMQYTICTAIAIIGTRCREWPRCREGDGFVRDWHEMITRIEVNKYGIASVWLKERGLLVFVPATDVGGYQVVAYAPLSRKLRSRGCGLPESLTRN